MNIVKHIDSWGKYLTWAVEFDGAVVFTANTRKACKEWVLAQGKKPVFIGGKIVKQH